jgi:hypothetical protein
VIYLDACAFHEKFELVRAEFDLYGTAFRVPPCQLEVTVISEEKAGLRDRWKIE